MMPPRFQIGQKVEILGPTIAGCKLHVGEKFTISNECHDAYTGGGFPWYPASSLRVVEDAWPCPHARLHPDIRKVLCHAPVEEAMLKPPCSLLLTHGRCYKMGDLDKPEELKIGDWVKTISGTIFRIGDIYPFVDGSTSVWVSKDGGVQYPSHCLRKLTPAEIAIHTGTIGYKTQEIQDEVENALEAIRNLIAPDVYERLSAIEREIKGRTFDKTPIADILKRLAVLEGERPEVIDREQIRIPANAYISLRSDDNGKVSVNYSDGGFELAKAVLDSMKET